MPLRLRIRLWWARLWVRKDEFHWSLELDDEAILYMDDEQLTAYRKDVAWRRQIAHLREMKDWESRRKDNSSD